MCGELYGVHRAAFLLQGKIITAKVMLLLNVGQLFKWCRRRVLGNQFSDGIIHNIYYNVLKSEPRIFKSRTFSWFPEGNNNYPNCLPEVAHVNSGIYCQKSALQVHYKFIGTCLRLWVLGKHPRLASDVIIHVNARNADFSNYASSLFLKYINNYKNTM